MIRNKDDLLTLAVLCGIFAVPMIFAIAVAIMPDTNFYYGPQDLERLYGTERVHPNR
jgi:hypothetical protein